MLFRSRCSATVPEHLSIPVRRGPIGRMGGLPRPSTASVVAVARAERPESGGSLAATKSTSAKTTKKKADSGYGAENITVLEGVEHVRKRPGMYIGTTSSRGLHHLVYEVVDNSVDEAMAGACDRIVVTLHKDGSCSVADNGRGIPVTKIPNSKDRRPAVEVVLTTLNAGGKLDRKSTRLNSSHT